MSKKEEYLENFKAAITSTAKSLSNSNEINISFGGQITKSEKNLINLPDIENVNKKINFDEIRALADSKSLKIRFSNKTTLKKYEPEGHISKKLYDISEKIRCEKIGIHYFKGVRKNIENFYRKRISQLDLKSSEDKIVESFENYMRVKFLNYKNEKEIEKKLKSYKKDLNEKFKNEINDLKALTSNQEKFNSIVSKLISNMNLDNDLDDDQKEMMKKKKIIINNQNLKIKRQKARIKKKLTKKCLLKVEYRI